MRETFSENDAELNPFHQFSKWWKEAMDSSIDEVNAMTLATADKEGIPTARIVLLKDYSEQGFVFFTNYQSRKGREICENPHVTLLFFWKELERQVMIILIPGQQEARLVHGLLHKANPSVIAPSLKKMSSNMSTSLPARLSFPVLHIGADTV